jgi:hypothetical protein
MTNIYQTTANSKFALFFRLLQLSPTYDLARRFREKSLSKRQKSFVPNDFKEVLSIYDRFGDVTKVHVFDWINFKCLKNFSPYDTEDAVMNLGSLVSGSDSRNLQDIINILISFNKNLQTRSDSPFYGVFLVNEEARMSTLIKEFKHQFIWYKNDLIQLERNRYQTSRSDLVLYKNRFHLAKLSAGIKLLEVKALKPDLVNWKLGFDTNFSDTFVERIRNTRGTYSLLDIQLAKVELGKITYRALRKFERMAEHAARGRFPCDEAIEYSSFDYSSIGERLRAYDSWKISPAGRKSGVQNKLINFLKKQRYPME